MSDASQFRVGFIACGYQDAGGLPIITDVSLELGDNLREDARERFEKQRIAWEGMRKQRLNQSIELLADIGEAAVNVIIRDGESSVEWFRPFAERALADARTRVCDTAAVSSA